MIAITHTPTDGTILEGTTRGDGTNRGVGPTKGSGGESAMRIALLCAGT